MAEYLDTDLLIDYIGRVIWGSTYTLQALI